MRADGFTVPVTFDRLTFLALLLAILALATFASGVVHFMRRGRVRAGRFVGSTLLLLLGLGVFAVAGWFQTYRTLTYNEWIATVRAANVDGQAQTMLVTYTPVQNGAIGTPRTYTIQGDEWELGGDIIKWQDYLNILGVHTGYRTTRLMGYYEDANDYRSKTVTAIDLNGGKDGAYTFLLHHADLVPFVRATYGNDVRLRPDSGTTYKVYVSTSGYWAAAS